MEVKEKGLSFGVNAMDECVGGHYCANLTTDCVCSGCSCCQFAGTESKCFGDTVEVSQTRHK